MEWFEEFIFRNFIIILVALMLVISSIKRYRHHPRISFYTILAISCVLFLAVFGTLENFCKSIINPDLTLLFAVFGYTLRPICIYLFILLNDDSVKGKVLILSALPLIINTIIYFLAFIPQLKELVVYFEVDGDQMSFGGGVLRYSSHVVSALYMLYLLYYSFSSWKFKKLSRAIVAFSCSLAVIGSVVVESFFNAKGDIYILNITISICILIYYLYLNIEHSEIDELTGLYKGELYNTETGKNNHLVSGVIVYQIDVEDNSSDQENDITYAVVARIIMKNINRRMIAYRINDNKFLLTAYQVKRETLNAFYEKTKDALYASNYPVEIGIAYKDDKNERLMDLVLRAERMLTLSKANMKEEINLRRTSTIDKFSYK